MKNKKIALVTEAGNDLGKQFAHILLENGYEVIVAACSDNLESLSHDKDSLLSYDLVEIDFTSEQHLYILKDKINNTYGKLDLLINNAEIVNGFGHKIDQLDVDDVRKVFEINFFSIIKTIQILKPLLLKCASPRIINITSSLGDIDKMKDESFCYYDYCLTAYSTSKAALNLFTQLQTKEFESSKISMSSFDPILMENCTHNSATISDVIKNKFISLLTAE